MKANPDKFQAIAIGPKTNKHNLSFDLKGNKITLPCYRTVIKV
jgi:hypothetical protein